jgi:hypothetical protein
MTSLNFRTVALAGQCPVCQHPFEAITGTGRPQPGSITLCLYCRVFLILTGTLQTRLLSNREWLALDADTRALLSRVRDALPVR